MITVIGAMALGQSEHNIMTISLAKKWNSQTLPSVLIFSVTMLSVATEEHILDTYERKQLS
jgi:hypothetical protein